MPKFSILQIMFATFVVAALLALTRWISPFVGSILFFVFLALAYCAVLTIPTIIVFTTIAFARQKQGYLDIKTNAFLKPLLWLWGLSLGAVITASFFLPTFGW